MTIEQLEKQFNELNSSVSTMKKDYELKLSSANKEAESWKNVASQKEEENKKFKEDAEKATKEKEKAYAEARNQENKTFLENLKKDGRISPAMQEVATKLMESMNAEATIYTSDIKDGKKISHTQLSLFKEFLSSMGKSPVFRQMSKIDNVAEKETPTNSEEKQFTKIMTKGGEQTYQVDGTELHNAALEYQQNHKVDYATALVAAEKILKQAA